MNLYCRLFVIIDLKKKKWIKSLKKYNVYRERMDHVTLKSAVSSVRCINGSERTDFFGTEVSVCESHYDGHPVVVESRRFKRGSWSRNPAGEEEERQHT